jgi:hypothetical protein
LVLPPPLSPVVFSKSAHAVENSEVERWADAQERKERAKSGACGEGVARLQPLAGRGSASVRPEASIECYLCKYVLLCGTSFERSTREWGTGTNLSLRDGWGTGKGIGADVRREGPRGVRTLGGRAVPCQHGDASEQRKPQGLQTAIQQSAVHVTVRQELLKEGPEIA